MEIYKEPYKRNGFTMQETYIEPYKCHCCGASLPIKIPLQETIRCEYCGATYIYHGKYNERPTYKKQDNSFVKPLMARKSITEEVVRMYGAEEMVRHAKKDIVMAIAEEIAEHMNFEVMDDPMNFCKTIVGRLRVVDKDFYFEGE